MSRRYVLWLINAVQDWPHEDLLAALRSGGDEAVLGDRELLAINDHATALARPPPYDYTEYSQEGALMHEGGFRDPVRDQSRRSASHKLFHSFDEYFVPIPVKCIGVPEQVGAAARARGAPVDDDALAAFCRDYSEYFTHASATFVQRYWDRGFSGAPTSARPPRHPVECNEVRMHTLAGVGYYEILLAWNRRAGHEGDRHVLLGYSQGGLVARFLAHLDEHVFRADLVRGLVTVQTPNFGSPVADAHNARNVEGALRTLLREAMRALVFARENILPLLVPGELLGLVNYAIAHGDEITIDGLDGQMSITMDELRTRLETRESDGDARAFLAMLISARKWMSGLARARSGVEFAFQDLSPARGFAGTHRYVLRAINEAGHKMPHGAVIGCNGSLRAILGRGLRGMIMATAARTLGHLDLAQLTSSYRAAFDEHPREPTPGYDELLALYRGPIARSDAIDLDIHARAHDCVIPSSHQLLRPARPSPAFLGNRVNRDANHLSGAMRTDTAPTDLALTLDLLRQIPARDIA